MASRYNITQHRQFLARHNLQETRTHLEVCVIGNELESALIQLMEHIVKTDMNLFREHSASLVANVKSIWLSYAKIR